MKRRLWILVIPALAAAVLASSLAAAHPAWSGGLPAPAAPVGSTFSYQGRLLAANAPANGSYDFRFALFSAEAGGEQAGPVLTRDDVVVAGGQFTVQLDFGNVFDGAALFLDIAVRAGNSTGEYTALLPRQPITTAPYAQSVPWNGLRGVPAGFADKTDNDTTYSAGQGLELNGTTFKVVAPVDIMGTKSGRTGAVLSSQAGGTDYALRATGQDSYTAVIESSNGTALYASSGGGSPNSFAGYFVGNVNVSGALTKGGGAFKIDHPLDPENKVLYHSFVESPDMLNIYNGNVTLDETGQAVVEMPDWFQALNMDFRYQLTPIGAPGPDLYIAQEIQDNQFKIAGGEAEMKVSWQVTGVRHDPYATAHRIPVEEEKPPGQQGYYLYPEAYNVPASSGIDAAGSPQAIQSEGLQ